MSQPFRGTINVDIRDSVPDWAPFEPPKAPDGAPSVVYIVLDDVGFSAMSCYGGPIETPRPQLASPRDRYTYFPDTAEVPEAQAVNIRTGPSRSAPWSTSPPPARKGSCSRTGPGSAATPCT